MSKMFECSLGEIHLTDKIDETHQDAMYVGREYLATDKAYYLHRLTLEDDYHTVSKEQVLWLQARLQALKDLDVFQFGKAYEMVEVGPSLVVVSEFLEGFSLEEVMSFLRMRGRQVPLDIVLAVAHQMIRFLQRWQEVSGELGDDVLTRSLYPTELFFLEDGRIKGRNTGLSEAYRRLDSFDPFAHANYLGYLSPEEVKGTRLTFASTMFTVGVVLWELLNGARLFLGRNSLSTLRNILEGELPQSFRDAAQEPSYLGECQDWITKLLSRDPSTRQTDLQAHLKQIESWVPALSRGQAKDMIADWLGAWERELEGRRVSLPYDDFLSEPVDEDPIVDTPAVEEPFDSVDPVAPRLTLDPDSILVVTDDFSDTVPEPFKYQPTTSEELWHFYEVAPQLVVDWLDSQSGDLSELLGGLLTALRSPESKVRHRAVWMMHEMGPDLSEVVDSAIYMSPTTARAFLSHYVSQILKKHDKVSLSNFFTCFFEDWSPLELEVASIALLRVVFVSKSVLQRREESASYLAEEVAHVKNRLFERIRLYQGEDIPSEKEMHDWIRDEVASTLSTIQMRKETYKPSYPPQSTEDLIRILFGTAPVPVPLVPLPVSVVPVEEKPSPVTGEIVAEKPEAPKIDLLPQEEASARTGMFDFLRGEKKTLQAPTEPSKISVKEEEILEEEELYVADEEDFVDELERIFEMEDEADLDGFLDLEESEAIAIEGPPEPSMQEEPAPEIPLGGMEAPTGEKGAVPTPKKKSKARKKAAPNKKDEAPSVESRARRRTSGLREQAKEEQIGGPGLSLGQPPPAEGAGGAPFPPPAPMAPSVPRSPAAPAPSVPRSPAAPAPPAPRAPAPPAPAPSQGAAPPPPPLASFDAPAMKPPEVPPPLIPKRGAAPAKPPTGPGGPPVAPAPAQAAPPPPKSSMAPPPVVAHIPAPTPLAPAPDEVEIPEPSSEYAAAETPYFADDEEISLSKSEAPPLDEFGGWDAGDDDEEPILVSPPQTSLGDAEDRYGMPAPIERRDAEEKKVYPELYGREEAPVDANLARPKPAAPELDRRPMPDLEVPVARQAPLPSSMPPPAPLQPAAKSSGGFLRGCAKVVGGILLAPIILPTFLVVGVVWGCAKIVQGIFRGFGWLFMKGFSHLEKKAKEKGVPTFEMFFSDNAGKPGPLERAVAHSAMMSRAIQATVGVRFVLFIHAIDTFVDLFVGYISGIYQSWKMMKTISRKIRREMDGSQADSVAEDLAECRVRLARIFAFAGCYSEELRMRFSEHERLRDVTKSSFPLKEILGVRGHIDDMERDLNFLTSAQTVAFLKGSVWKFFGSLIPNPFQFLTAWKDIFIMIFFMRYPRRDIEFMMADLLHSYQTTIGFLRLLLKDAEQAGEIDLDGQQKRLLIEALMEYEEVLLARTGAVGGAMEIPELTDAVERDRNSLQRLNRVLCSPTRTVEPRYWSRFDLLKEALHIEEAGRFHPHIALEVEGWLTRQVERAMNEKGLKIDRSEKERRLREALDYHKRLKLYRKAERKHLFF